MALAQRFNTNTQAQNGTDTGVHLSMNDIVPIQPISKGTSSDDEKVTVQQLQSIPYGIGNLSGTTYNVTLLNYPADYTLRVGSKMLVKFASAKSGTTVLNLAINGQTIPMQMQGSALTEIFANQILEFTFVGTIASGIHTITSANASAGISASQLNGALANYEVTYTTLAQLGITSPCTVNDIYKKLPKNCSVMININDRTQSVTDVPMNFGILEIHKTETRCLCLYLRTLTDNNNTEFYINNNIHNESNTWERITTENYLRNTFPTKTDLDNYNKFIVRGNVSAGYSRTFSLPKINQRIYTLKIISNATNYALYDILVYASTDEITSINIIPEENQNGEQFTVTVNTDKTLTVSSSIFAVISIVES